MSQIENPDYLQSIAKSIRVFRMHDNFLVMMKITKNSLAANLSAILDKSVEQHCI